MRAKMILTFFVVFLGLTLSATFAEMSKKDLQDIYTSYLSDEGYRPGIDKEGDVYFKVEGKTFWIFVNEDDLSFFEIVFPNFWKIESDEERSRALVAASNASRTTKVVKVYLTDSDTTAVAQVLIPNPQDFKTVFPRLIKIIQIAVDKYATEMKTSQVSKS